MHGLATLQRLNNAAAKRGKIQRPAKVKDKYPEHTKQAKVLNQSQPIGEFLDWAFNEKGWELCEYNGAEERNFSIGKRIEEILAQYFDIDLNKLEDEKRAMLEEIRAKK